MDTPDIYPQSSPSNFSGKEKSDLILQSLGTIIDAIDTSTSIDTIYTMINHLISRIFSPISLIITQYDHDAEMIIIVYSNEITKGHTITSYPLGEDIISKAIISKQSIQIEYSEEQRTSELMEFEITAQTGLCIPMIQHNIIIGAFTIFNFSPQNKFKKEDVHFFHTIASLLAMKIQHEYFREKLNFRKEFGQKQTKIIKKIGASHDTDSILITTLLELCRSMNAQKGLIQLYSSEKQYKFSINNRTRGSNSHA